MKLIDLLNVIHYDKTWCKIYSLDFSKLADDKATQFSCIVDDLNKDFHNSRILEIVSSATFIRRLARDTKFIDDRLMNAQVKDVTFITQDIANMTDENRYNIIDVNGDIYSKRLLDEYSLLETIIIFDKEAIKDLENKLNPRIKITEFDKDIMNRYGTNHSVGFKTITDDSNKINNMIPFIEIIIDKNAE